jgi:hypothetical protein
VCTLLAEALFFFFLVIYGYEKIMDMGDSDLCLIYGYGLKICGGCRGFQDLLLWVIDLGQLTGLGLGGNL